MPQKSLLFLIHQFLLYEAIMQKEKVTEYKVNRGADRAAI